MIENKSLGSKIFDILNVVILIGEQYGLADGLKRDPQL